MYFIFHHKPYASHFLYYSRGKNVFIGLDSFLEESYTDVQREIFFCRVLPYMIRKAVEIENLKPTHGLRVAGQKGMVFVEI